MSVPIVLVEPIHPDPVPPLRGAVQERATRTDLELPGAEPLPQGVSVLIRIGSLEQLSGDFDEIALGEVASIASRSEVICVIRAAKRVRDEVIDVKPTVAGSRAAELALEVVALKQLETAARGDWFPAH